ncbi:hypothetical protein ACP8ZO_23665, partial [Escherichia coli]
MSEVKSTSMLLVANINFSIKSDLSGGIRRNKDIFLTISEIIYWPGGSLLSIEESMFKSGNPFIRKGAVNQ